MKYNICIVRPGNYAHSSAFSELAELVCFGLCDLGYSASIRENGIDRGAHNILIGCHLLGLEAADQLPSSTIMLNTEQLGEDIGDWRENVFAWASRFEVWDYSRLNLQRLSSRPHRKLGFLPIGYHERLARIGQADEQDIDVLFYGSLNERRQKILVDLIDAGLKVKAVFGVYGQARDALIARSKIVLNLHLYESKIFEIVRVFYLMINGKAVVGEVGEDTTIEPCYLGGIQAAPYPHLVEWCRLLASDLERRRALEAQALGTMRRLPQDELMASLLTP